MISITIWIFLLVQVVVLLHTLLGCLTIPLQGALMTDGLGHSVIFGIAISFLFVHDLHSGFLFFGAIVAGVLMNLLVNLLSSQKLIHYDASIGVSFSFFFALGILLISIYARNIHLDLDMILTGNIEFAIYDQLIINNISYGPKMFFIASFLLLILSFLAYYFYDIICMILFDPMYASINRYPIKTYKLISLLITSIIVVISFNALGAIILVGIATSPYGWCWKSSSSLKIFIWNSIFFASLVSFLSTCIALYMDLSLSGTIGLFLTGTSLASVLYNKY